MRLQKQLSRKAGTTEYAKWVLVIPPATIAQLNWQEGQELKDETKNGSLLLRPFTPSELAQQHTADKPLYEEFRSTIESFLRRHPDGLTWTQLKATLNLPQEKPNNQWVRKLEQDIGLKRLKQGNAMLWKLENNTIVTIGYEGLSTPEFVQKLRSQDIKLLVDIRQVAFSRKNGFSKSPLDAELKAAGIRYRHMPSLGSPKALRDQLHEDWDYDTFFKEYQKHVHDKDVLEELRDLEGLSKMRRTAIMCFEKEAAKCHRSIVASLLKERGWTLINL